MTTFGRTKGLIFLLNIPWFAFLFQTLPETIASTAFCFALVKLPLKWKLILKIGIIYGVITFLVRSFPIPFGLHTIILIIVLATLLVFYTHCKLSSALISGLVNMIIVATGEIIFGLLISKSFNIPIEYAYANQFIRVMLGTPQVLMLFAIAFIINNFTNKNSLRYQKNDRKSL